MTDQEKIEVFERCLDETYQDDEVKPILEDIFKIFRNDYSMYHVIGLPILNKEKIEYMNSFLPFFKFVVKNNHIELFRDLIIILLRPGNNCKNSRIIIDLMELLLHPKNFCQTKRNNHSLDDVIKYLLQKSCDDFCLKYQNNPFISLFIKLQKYLDDNEVDCKTICTVVTRHFILNDIAHDKYIPAIDFGYHNNEYINDLINIYYNGIDKEQFYQVLMDRILSEVEKDISIK